ncbi:MAG: hypothetical protein RMI85_03935, partial [Candidatus Korarchaeum sp.]|nr:hypothetical protein [Candidatus Korarchaeum sp.]
MRPKYKVYSFRLLVSSIVGILNGLLRLDPSIGILAFIFAYFLVTPLSLRIWRDELKGIGLMELYKEAIGTSILALILIWSLSMSFTGYSVMIYVVKANNSGIYPIETLDGRKLLPNNEELFGYNAVSLTLSNDVVNKVRIGVCTERKENISLRIGNYDLTLEGSELVLRTRSNLSSSEDRDFLRKIFGNLTVYRNGTLVLGNMSLPPNTTKKLKLGISNVSLSYERFPELILDMRAPLGSQLEFPVSMFLTEVVEK